jgi:hypothetical protein
MTVSTLTTPMLGETGTTAEIVELLANNGRAEPR